MLVKHYFNMPNLQNSFGFSGWKHLETCGQTRKHRNKNVSEFVTPPLVPESKQVHGLLDPVYAAQDPHGYEIILDSF